MRKLTEAKALALTGRISNRTRQHMCQRQQTELSEWDGRRTGLQALRRSDICLEGAASANRVSGCSSSVKTSAELCSHQQHRLQLCNKTGKLSAHLGSKLHIAKQGDIIFRHDLFHANKHAGYHPLESTYLCIPATKSCSICFSGPMSEPENLS